MFEFAMFITLNQIAAFVFSGIAAIQSFLYLNLCSYRTWIVMRFSFIIVFSASIGVILYLLAGNQPHWLLTAIMLALAVQMLADRRKPNV